MDRCYLSVRFHLYCSCLLLLVAAFHRNSNPYPTEAMSVRRYRHSYAEMALHVATPSASKRCCSTHQGKKNQYPHLANPGPHMLNPYPQLLEPERLSPYLHTSVRLTDPVCRRSSLGAQRLPQLWGSTKTCVRSIHLIAECDLTIWLSMLQYKAAAV